MYALKNGVLHQDGKPIIAMGQSYYPSFHEAKYPAPPWADRVGLMKEDIRLMREAGFQFLRVAALGDVTLEGDAVRVRTDFIDSLLREAHDKGMATSIRLQGYVMNLRGYDDYLMRNEKDEPMEAYWSAFMRSSLFHKGIVQDNKEASQALARHFEEIPGVVSYQIYNEPHYPYNGIFDYHPMTLAAYQAWRAARGLPPQEPPRRRPAKGEDPEPWIQWRLFSMRAMSDFLNNTAQAVKEAAPEKETYTCMTAAPVGNELMASGIDYFDDAEGMDTVGITSYISQEGADSYAAAYQFDMAECAAALQGKHAWTIEIDARTRMPGRKTHEEVYSLLAAGHKGIVFYEWRGDYPDQGTPNPDNCGFIFNDGRKTEHYDRSVAMVRFVNRHSTLLASAEKQRDGVGLLFSQHAAAYGDAFMSGSINCAVHQSIQAYRELRKAQATVDILCARHLKENRLGIRLLLVPCEKNWLSQEEIRQIDAFVAAGGQAYFLRQTGTFGASTAYGWWGWNVELLPGVSHEFRGSLETEDVLEQSGVVLNARVSSRHLLHGMLRGAGYSLLILENNDPARRDVENAVVTLKTPCARAKFLSADAEIDLPGGAEIHLPPVKEGGVLWLESET